MDSRRERTERAVLRACQDGLELADLRRRVLATLRSAMTVDAAFFATADPETLLFTSADSEEPLAALASSFLDNELGGADVNTFTSLVRARGHVSSLDAATRRERMASERYRDLMRPIGLGDELRAALVVGGACWGYLCLHREDGERGFTAADVDLVRRVAPHIAHGLRQAALLHPPAPPSSRRPGVVLLDDRMELVATTPEADELLPLIGHDATGLPLPLSVYSVAAALTSADPTDRPPSVRVRAADGGWLNLHASRLRASTEHSRIAVVVEPAEPHSTLGILLAAYGLTARELDVARLVLRGAATRSISETLHISQNTVQDHLKSVFDKVGVRTRRDLVGRLLAGS
ncbi:LuxR C-terminal-related transcriptional regulator [Pseudonocardia sp. CA-107938]|uniref:LuxR C-terminal-related transcriptional regulator n=1 Tax=Pseudonocardia sp. CA-107938 TaxID=3240021 RepID=UPI003D92BF4C